MSGPANVDIPLYHGDTLTFSSDFGEDVDLTGYSILFQVREKGTLRADWSEYASIAGGQRLDIVVPGDPDPDGTLALPRPTRTKNYEYDIQLTAPGTGTVRTVLRGLVICQGDVSYD